MADTSKSGCYWAEEGGGIRHITATQAEVKEVPACVGKYCFNALIFGNISSACAKKYLTAASINVKLKLKFAIE